MLPPGWFSRVMARPVPSGRPGEGRLVYPGRAQRLALDRYLARHLATGGELAAKATDDDGLDPVAFPFLDLYSTLMDVPAEFAEDNLRAVFHDARLASGRLTWRGETVDPGAIEDIALMTVEGGRDDSSGSGQTEAAHGLCPRLPTRRRHHWTEPEACHFRLFHGRLWRQSILPQVADFVAGALKPRRRRRCE